MTSPTDPGETVTPDPKSQSCQCDDCKDFDETEDMYGLLLDAAEDFCVYCHGMGDSEDRIKVCTGCRVVGYCSKECQRSDWSTHKLCCSKDGGAKIIAAKKEWDRRKAVKLQHAAHPSP